jgi:hypothetical protein
LAVRHEQPMNADCGGWFTNRAPYAPVVAHLTKQPVAA